MLEVAMNDLKKAAMDFFNITQTQIVLFDENRNHLYSYPEKNCSFCDMVRSIPELNLKCNECDNIAFNTCDHTKKPCIYKCHMNLSEAMSPIIENNIIIGYIMIGQILNNNDIQTTISHSKKIAEKYNLDANHLLTTLNELQTVSDTFLYSTINMASMCACYLYCNKIIKDKSDILTHQLRQYIENHLSDELSVQILCKEFGLSRSKLYKLSLSAFGMGISSYILKQRIDEAKKLLSDSNKPIYEISESIGYSDANYFVRIFKESTGITPGKFRKQMKL